MPRTSAAVTRATPSDPRAPEAGPRTPAAAPGPPTPTSRVGAGRGAGPAAPVTADEGLALSAEVVERLREVVPRVADETVSTITREVPSYARPFSEAMGERIRAAVEVAHPPAAPHDSDRQEPQRLPAAWPRTPPSLWLQPASTLRAP